MKLYKTSSSKSIPFSEDFCQYPFEKAKRHAFQYKSTAKKANKQDRYMNKTNDYFDYFVKQMNKRKIKN